MNWQTLQIPFTGGLSQKSDARASSFPQLDIAVDVEFDEVGGVQLRYPYTAIGNNIFGGGTLSNCRKIFAFGNELLVFTDTALYSWDAAISAWVLKGTHLAVTTTETARFGTTSDQVDTDRAELAGTIVFTWCIGTALYAGAIDKTTGAVFVSPTQVKASASRPRLVACDTKIILTFIQPNGGNHDLKICALDPATPAAGWASPTTLHATIALYYDVCKRTGSDAVYVAVGSVGGASYRIDQVTAALAVTHTANPARTSDGPIAIASHPLGTHVQVTRTSSTHVKGDLLTQALADVFTDEDPGMICERQLSCVFRTVQNSGQYRCYLYSSDNTNGTQVSWVDDAGNVAASAAFLIQSVAGSPHPYDLASHAFAYGNDTYIVAMFGGSSPAAGTATIVQIQNTYFLYRDDGRLIAQAAVDRAAGFMSTSGIYNVNVGSLPSVQADPSNSKAFTLCGGARRLLTVVSESQGYSARNPREITFTFDDDDARRCVQLGETLYIAGGQITQYDGDALTEVGFHLYPWDMWNPGGTGAGTFAAGAYTWKETYRWDNAKGERERSTTANYQTATILAGKAKVETAQSDYLPVTLKTATGRLVAIEHWRTVVAPPVGAPFYLVTDVDPATVGNVNGYIANGGVDKLSDALADGDILLREPNPENDSVLESLGPPPATIIIATQDRIFLAGVAGAPSEIWYSRLRGSGEIASFNDLLVASIPADAGAITALAIQEEALIAFTATAVFALQGNGYDNTGGGSNYGPARYVTTDVGAVNAESVVYTPAGTVFKSAKGWYMLRGWTAEYIGAPVVDYDSETIEAIHVMESQHQIRAVSSQRILVFDYVVNQWSEWSTTGIDATIWQGTHTLLTSTNVYTQTIPGFGYGTVSYGIDVETAWIKLADLQGAGRVRWLEVLGESLTANAMTIRLQIARDYLYNVAVTSSLKARDIVSRNAITGVRSSARLITSAGFWNGTVTQRLSSGDDAAAPNTFTIVVANGGSGASSVVVNDGHIYDPVGLAWQVLSGNVGVLITLGSASAITVAQLEAAINTSTIVTVSRADSFPAATLADTTYLVQRFGQLAGGVSSGTTAPMYEDNAFISQSTRGRLQVRLGPTVQRCEAFKVRITSGTLTSTVSYGLEVLAWNPHPTFATCNLTGLGLEVGIERGLYRRLPAAQKV